jgi:predicted dinucleotide-utilizing enzyme
MAKALAEPGSRTIFGVLDVRRVVLHVPSGGVLGIDVLLASEAASFAAILASV